MLCFLFIFQITFLLLFLVLGLNFVHVLRLLFPDQPWEQEAGRGERRFCLENVAEEHGVSVRPCVSPLCPAGYLHRGGHTQLGLAPPTSRKGKTGAGF